VKRRVLQLLFALALLLTLAVGALWVRSFFASTGLYVGRVYNDGGRNVWEKWNALVTSRQLAIALWRLSDGRTGRDDVTPSVTVSYVTKPPVTPRLLERGAGPRLPAQLGFILSHRDSKGFHDVMDPAHASGNLYVIAAVPTWFAMIGCAGLAGLPVWLLRRDRRSRLRLRQGLCPACGYDLRGAAHERCPECGAAVADAMPV
jgi:hypothetical protein